MIDCKFFRIDETYLADWERAYWPLNVRGELEKMILWLTANPRRRKKNYQRFVVNWLNKEHAKIVRAQIESRAYARVGQNEARGNPERAAWILDCLAEAKRRGVDVDVVTAERRQQQQRP